MCKYVTIKDVYLLKLGSQKAMTQDYGRAPSTHTVTLEATLLYYLAWIVNFQSMFNVVTKSILHGDFLGKYLAKVIFEASDCQFWLYC